MSKRKASILIVDDEDEILRALQRSLAAHGYEVFTANNGEKALATIEQHTLNLMLLDLGLPGMSGLEVCKRVRAQSDLPIIVISVKNKERDKVLALDLGADDYVSKPFGINEVLARIRVALASCFPPISTNRTIIYSGTTACRFCTAPRLSEWKRGKTYANRI